VLHAAESYFSCSNACLWVLNSVTLMNGLEMTPPAEKILILAKFSNNMGVREPFVPIKCSKTVQPRKGSKCMQTLLAKGWIKKYTYLQMRIRRVRHQRTIVWLSLVELACAIVNRRPHVRMTQSRRPAHRCRAIDRNLPCCTTRKNCTKKKPRPKNSRP
jgi:hypothetical protein